MNNDVKLIMPHDESCSNVEHVYYLCSVRREWNYVYIHVFNVCSLRIDIIKNAKQQYTSRNVAMLLRPNCRINYRAGTRSTLITCTTFSFPFVCPNPKKWAPLQSLCRRIQKTQKTTKRNVRTMNNKQSWRIILTWKWPELQYILYVYIKYVNAPTSPSQSTVLCVCMCV